jgi:hypothetical protein
MSADEDHRDGSIMETLGVEVFWNAGGDITIKQARGSALVAFSIGEARLLMEGLASALGYRVTKQGGQTR